MFVRSIRPRKDELHLARYAKSHTRPELKTYLDAYVQRREEFVALIEKYEIFTPKGVTVEDAARMVGLALPKTKNS
jgi:hypothetical protein